MTKYLKTTDISVSIHHKPLCWGRVAEAAVSAGGPIRPFSWTHQPTLTGGSQGVPIQRNKLFTWTWVCPGASFQLDVPGTPSQGGDQEEASLPDARMNHLTWPLPAQRSSDSTPSSSRMTELLTLSLRKMPAILRKPISAACTHFQLNLLEFLHWTTTTTKRKYCSFSHKITWIQYIITNQLYSYIWCSLMNRIYSSYTLKS